MKIWVTKYALTAGVMIRNGKIEDSMAVVKLGGYTNYFHGQEFHTSEEAARSRVIEMIDAKQQSIKKQLRKLETLMVAVHGGNLPLDVLS